VIVRVLAREAQLQSGASIVAWIYRIMRKLWFDEMRSRRTRPHETIESACDIVGDDGDAIAERNDALAAVRRACAR
jgi:DNA-directed RNA polymerase specialized sigma24 family protein